MSHIPMSTTDEEPHIGCADANMLLYLGVIQVDILAPGLQEEGSLPGLLLVVPTSSYTARVHVL